MKILKLLIWNSILLICLQSFGQNLKNPIKLNPSQKLFKELENKEYHPIYLINGFYNENNNLYLTRIKENEIEKKEYFYDKNTSKYTKGKNIYGVWEVILKNKKINNLEALNKTYPFDKSLKNEILISGTVYNFQSKPMSNVTISNLDKREAYKTNSKGEYILKATKNDLLLFYSEGYQSKKIIVEDETEIDVFLDKNISLGSEMIKKPVIYLYPTEKKDIKLTLDFKGKLQTTFPEYINIWDVTAYPNGQIFDKKSQRFYSSLFWDGMLDFPKEHYNYQTGFIIPKNKLTSFLIEKLEFIGLNTSETNDFIQYWLPVLEKNKWNFIHFYVNSEYEMISKNTIDPKPETSIRLFMEFYGVEKSINIPEQKLVKTERKGFTLVEWGGSDVGNSINELKN